MNAFEALKAKNNRNIFQAAMLISVFWRQNTMGSTFHFCVRKKYLAVIQIPVLVIQN